MEVESVIKERLNAALVLEDWKAYNEYKSISVLILYWEASGHPGFQEEAIQIGELFEKDFLYNVDYYTIPSINSHRRFDTKINTFFDEHEGPDNLMIIYYGGHGDADDDHGQGKLAVWAAQSEGGPTVNWSSIQPKLSEQRSHILVLLDCCFAAQAARANQKRAIPANVELLAACAMRVKTILPGPLSFTTHLIKHLRDALDISGYARISDIANMLAHRDSGCIQTLVHFSGLGNRKATIRLDRFDPNPSNSLRARREVAWLTLRVSLRDVLTEPLISDIIQWFKAHPSRKVAKLTVEEVVLSTGNLHNFIHEEGRGGNSGSRFK